MVHLRPFGHWCAALLLASSLGSAAQAQSDWSAVLDSLRAGYARANAARDRGDPSASLRELETLHLLVPDWPWLGVRLAGAEAQLGHWESARQRLLESLALGVGLDARDDPKFAPLWEGPGGDSLRLRLEAARAPVGPSEVLFRLGERDLFPEGIAYDPLTRSYFLSSLYKRKIVAIDSSGTPRDFTGEAQDSIWSGLGMKVDASRRRLWLATSEQEFMRGFRETETRRAALLCYDLDRGHLLKRLVLEVPSDSSEGAPHLLNDLVIAPDGDVYVTDTEEGTVYRAEAETGEWERLLAPGTLPNANGIALDASRSRLFVAHAFGIARVDPATRAVTALPPPIDASLTAIDGLYLVGDELIGMQTELQRILRLQLDPAGERVVGWSLLRARDPDFREITTGVVVDRTFVYVATSQYGSFLRAGGVPPMEELGEILIMRVGL